MIALYVRMLTLICALVLVACNNGVREFELYSTAFKLQDEAAQKVLDKVAFAERWHWRNLNGSGSRFQPDQAAYYIDAGDPPYTASMRRTLKALSDYNSALIGLTNGQSIESIRTKIASTATNLDTAVSLLSSGRLNPSTRISVAVTPIAGELALAKELFRSVLDATSKESFRKQLVRAYPTMKTVLLTFRKGSDRLYFAVASVGGITRKQRLKDRELFASWVLLIDDTLKTMEQAVIAVQSNMRPADIDALAEQSIELRILAEKLSAARNRQ